MIISVIKDRMKNIFCLWGRQQPRKRVSWLKFETKARILPVKEARSLASFTFTTKKFFFLSFIFYLHFSTKNSEYTKKSNFLRSLQLQWLTINPCFSRTINAFWTVAGLHSSLSAKVLMGGIVVPVHTYLLKQLLLSQMLFVNMDTYSLNLY